MGYHRHPAHLLRPGRGRQRRWQQQERPAESFDSDDATGNATTRRRPRRHLRRRRSTSAGGPTGACGRSMSTCRPRTRCRSLTAPSPACRSPRSRRAERRTHHRHRSTGRRGLRLRGRRRERARSGARASSRSSRTSGDGQGAVYRQVVKGPGGRSIDADYEVTDYQPPSHLAFRAIAGPGAPGRLLRHLIDADGSTALTFRLAAELGGLEEARSWAARSRRRWTPRWPPSTRSSAVLES